jgi:vacuolar protein sorting-associated protein VTA1
MAAPASLKAIKPYLERATELQDKDPVVAYHCRLYALQEAMRLRANLPKEDMGFVMTLMDTLEKEKSVLGELDNPSVLVENFAQDLFQRADDADRAGRYDMRTGKAFLVASQLIDVCKQFGELPADLAEKAKYAKWRFVEIAKATKEGRTPAPPRGVEPEPEEALVIPPPPEMPTDPTMAAPPATPPALPPAQDPYGLPPTAYPPTACPPAAGAPEPVSGLPSYMGLPMAPAPAAPAPPPAYYAPPVPAAPGYPPPPPAQHMVMPPGGMPGFGAPPPLPTRGPSFKPDRIAMVEAQRLCSSASSALQFQVHDTAALTLALTLALTKRTRTRTPTRITTLPCTSCIWRCKCSPSRAPSRRRPPEIRWWGGGALAGCVPPSRATIDETCDGQCDHDRAWGGVKVGVGAAERVCAP